jgi:hypothetical protein
MGTSPAGRIAFAISAALGLSVQAAQQSPALTAAFAILGASEEAMATLNYCRAIDSTNADVYDGLVLRILNLYMPYIQRTDEILPVEGMRSGHGERFYYTMLPGLRSLAQTEAKDLAATLRPEQVIASCRAERGDFQQQRGLFVSPDIRFPKEVRALKDWR